jgi:hypothetical protein
MMRLKSSKLGGAQVCARATRVWRVWRLQAEGLQVDGFGVLGVTS